MERDFLGLSLKESLAVVKEEINNDGCKDSGMFLSYNSQSRIFVMNYVSLADFVLVGSLFFVAGISELMGTN